MSDMAILHQLGVGCKILHLDGDGSSDVKCW